MEPQPIPAVENGERKITTSSVHITGRRCRRQRYSGKVRNVIWLPQGRASAGLRSGAGYLNIFSVQMNKILILFGLRARDMLPRRQNIEAEWVIGKILGNKDLRSFLRVMDVVLEFGGKFAHMLQLALFCEVE
jgi:hypothetical protein